MMHTTKGRITDKWTLIGAWSDEMPLPDAYYFAIWFYNPRTDQLHEQHFRCTARQYEQYDIGDWLQLHLNTAI
jgi:hypothetical protein